jgi:uncharacterized delta-60 repeat protein
VIDPQQRINVVGQLDLGADQTFFDARRMLHDGTVDTNFGMSGSVQYTRDDGPDGGTDVAIQPDGKLVVVGGTVTPDLTVSTFGIVRYLSDGTMDPDFGISGETTVAFGAHSDPGGVALDAAGRIIVVGWAQGGAALVRLTQDGQPDLTFGTGGQLTELGRPALAYAAVSTDGTHVLAAGTSTSNAISGAVLARYADDGERDPVFGTDGFAESAQLAGVTSFANDLALQVDGRILVVGGYGDPSSSDMFVARYCP